MKEIDAMVGRTALTLALALSWPLLLAGQEDSKAAAVPQTGVGISVASDASLYPQDPADAAYREARERLNREDYREAADLFRRLRLEYPNSRYAAQSLYYEAFALYRNGREDDLRKARDALRALMREHEGAAVAQQDAQSLMARIEGALARQHGDAEAAEELAEKAREAAVAGVQRGERRGAACEGEDEMRIAALNALLQMNSERALPILEKVLANRDDDPCSVEMRRKAVFLLAQHISEDQVELMLDIVRNDPDPEVRSQAVFWLSQVPGERTVQALEEIILRQEDGELQKKALFALSQHDSPRASQILRDYAMQEGADPELRAQAIFWLGQRGDPETGAFLRQVYQTTEEREIKEKILFALAQTRDRESREWLLGIARDGNEPMEMRKKAIFWASQSGVSIEEIAELYDDIPDRAVREQIIFALSQKHSDAAVDKLLEIARSETDVELRKKAIFWLSQSDDPRVAEFLLEIIEG